MQDLGVKGFRVLGLVCQILGQGRFEGSEWALDLKAVWFRVLLTPALRLRVGLRNSDPGT